MANKMAEVARLLGVELDEEFEVDDFCCGENNRSTCRLTENGLEVLCRSIGCGDNIIEKWARNSRMLDGLLCGEDRFNIVRKPWMPKREERYYTYIHENFGVGFSYWDGSPQCLAEHRCGMVFRTKEEAIAARPRVFKEMTGKKWKDE